MNDVNDNRTMGEREAEMAKAKHKENIHVVEPEVMDGQVVPYSDMGAFPELQNDLIDTLSSDFEECADMVEQIKRISAGKKELYKSVLADAKRSYARAQEDLRKRGV